MVSNMTPPPWTVGLLESSAALKPIFLLLWILSARLLRACTSQTSPFLLQLMAQVFNFELLMSCFSAETPTAPMETTESCRMGPAGYPYFNLDSEEAQAETFGTCKVATGQEGFH